MASKIQFSITYDYPVAQVWKALTDATAMSQWLMPCDFEPRVGHKFQFKTKPYPGFDGIVNCEVLELKEPEIVSYTWNGGGLKNTIVTFKLKSQNEQTLLEFEHSGFEGLVNRFFTKRILANGWKKTILKKLLPQYLAQ